MNVEQTLEERGDRYGSYINVAAYSQKLKNDLRAMSNWRELPPHMRESLEMICNKIARIMSGDFNYADSWHDIAGYAGLVEKTLGE